MRQWKNLSGGVLAGLLLVASVLLVAATSNIDGALVITPKGEDTNALVVNNTSATNKFVIDSSGNITTLAGTVALSGASTITGDMTFSGAGVDILANADNQNDIGTEAASFAEAYFKILDADTSINSDGTLAVTGVSTLTGRVDAQANVQVDSGGTGSATEGCVGFAGVAGDGTVSLCADNDSGEWDGFQFRGPSDPGNAGDTDIMYATTSAVVVAVDLDPSADSARSLGDNSTRFLEVFADQRNYEVAPAVVTTVGPTNIGTWVVLADASSNVAGVDLPDASTMAGRIIRVVWGDTTTNNVEIKSDGGTIGLPDPTDSFIAAATGVTPSANNGFAEWQSDGTNWVFVGGDAVVSL